MIGRSRLSINICLGLNLSLCMLLRRNWCDWSRFVWVWLSGFDNILIVHSSGEKIDEGRILINKTLVVNSIDLSSFFFVLLSHSKEHIEQTKSHNYETNHELHDLERHVSLLLKIKFLVESQNFWSFLLFRLSNRFLIFGDHKLINYWSSWFHESFDINFFFGDMNLTTIFCSGGFNNETSIFIKLPLVRGSSLDILFITENSNVAIDSVNVDS